MSKEVRSGQDALDILNAPDESGGSGLEWSPFKVGSTYTVKVANQGDLITFYSYGIYGKTSSFVAKNPSKKSQKGFPQDNLTPWDKAFLYHYNKSEKFGDEESEEAYKYKPELRFGFIFFDLDQGKEIAIDVSKKQAQTIGGAIKKQADKGKLGKVAFEVEKTEGGGIMVTPIVDLDELDKEQRKNFDEAPKEIDVAKYHDINYEADDEEMVKLLKQVGFDVTVLDLGEDLEGVDITDDDLPF